MDVVGDVGGRIAIMVEDMIDDVEVWFKLPTFSAIVALTRYMPWPHTRCSRTMRRR